MKMVIVQCNDNLSTFGQQWL